MSAGPGPAPGLETATGRLDAARVDDAVRTLAARLRASWTGDEPPRVAHRFGLVPEAVVAIHAVALAGARLAPVHPAWDDDQVARFLGAVDPDLLVTETASGPVGSDWSAVAEPSGDESGARLLVRAGTRTGRVRSMLPPGTDVLLSTSGSTGSPRVVCHSWDTLRANAVAAARRNGYGPGDAWLATLAWAHVGGLAVAVRAASVGGRIAFGPARFAVSDAAAALERTAASHISLVPAMLHALLAARATPPAALRCALVGGAATPPALAGRALEAGWPVALTYGLTEMGSQVATGPPGEAPAEPGVVGRPLDGVEVRIGRDGAIELRGPSRSLGTPGHPLEPGAWLSTGDLGSLDEDGRLRVTGRRADRIVTGGTNVDPAEVEAVLAAHAQVRETCVVGTPDDVWGEIVTAVVVVEPGGAGDGLEDLRAWAAGRLTGARRPRRWWRLDALPRAAGGKVDRARVRRMASERENWE